MHRMRSPSAFALTIMLLSVFMISAITFLPSTSQAATATASSTSSVEHFGWLGYDGNGTIYMTYAITNDECGDNYNNAYYFPGPYNITNTSYKQDTTQVYYGGTDGANWVNVTDYNGATLRTGSNITYNGPNGKFVRQFGYHFNGLNNVLEVTLPVMVTGVTYTPNQMTDFNNQINYTVYWSNLSARFSGIPHLGSTELDAELAGAGGLNVTDLNYKTDYLSNSTLGDLGTTSAITFGIMAVAFVSFPEVSVPLALIAIASDAGTFATTHVKSVNKALIIPNEPQSTSYLPDYANWTVTNQTYSLLNQTANFEGTTFNMENINNSWSVGTIYDFHIDKSDFGKKGYLTICDNNTLGFDNYPDTLPEMGGTVGASPELKIPIAPANVIYGTAYLGGIPASKKLIQISCDDNGTLYFVRTNNAGKYRFFAEPGHHYSVSYPGVSPSGTKEFYINPSDYNETNKNIPPTGSVIYGYIDRPTGGMSDGLSGETVTLTNSSGFSEALPTNSSGYYSFGPLNNGSYNIEVEDSINRTLTIASVSLYEENFLLYPDYLKGYVRNSLGNNVGNALVTITSGAMAQSVRTSPDGSYSFPIVYSGAYSIQAGFYTEDGNSGTSFSDINGIVHNVNIQTSAGGGSSDTIAGYVSNSLGTGASGVNITMKHSGGTLTTTTNSGGYYDFSSLIGTGDYYITASDSGVNAYNITNITSINGITYSAANMALGIYASDSITGHVKFPDGSYASGASVSLGSGSSARTTTTNSNGHYSFTGIKTIGKFDLSASYSTTYSGSGSILVHQIDGHTYTLTITMSQIGGGGGCVLAGTMIMTSRNNAVEVQNLTVGSKILSYNTMDHKFFENSVTSINVSNVTSIFNIDNGLLYVSGATDQPVYVMLPNGTQEWIMVGYITTKEMIFDPMNNTWVNVTSIQIEYGNYTVYDISGSKTFYSGGYPRSDYIANGLLLDRKL